MVSRVGFVARISVVKRARAAWREPGTGRYGGAVTEAGERLNERGFAELRERITARSELHPLDPAQSPIA